MIPEHLCWCSMAAAEYSGYNEQYLRRLLRAGRLEGIKIGQVWLIETARKTQVIRLGIKGLTLSLSLR